MVKYIVSNSTQAELFQSLCVITEIEPYTGIQEVSGSAAVGLQIKFEDGSTCPLTGGMSAAEACSFGNDLLRSAYESVYFASLRLWMLGTVGRGLKDMDGEPATTANVEKAFQIAREEIGHYFNVVGHLVTADDDDTTDPQNKEEQSHG